MVSFYKCVVMSGGERQRWRDRQGRRDRDGETYRTEKDRGNAGTQITRLSVKKKNEARLASSATLETGRPQVEGQPAQSIETLSQNKTKKKQPNKMCWVIAHYRTSA